MSSNSSIQNVLRDVLDLCELQMQLLSVDAQAAKRKLTTAVIFSVVSMALAGSALTVLMIGLGFVLGELSELSTGASLSIVAVVFFAVVGVFLFIAAKAVQAAAQAMSETKSELAENVRWLKATMLSPSTSARNQLRRESFQTHGSSQRYYTPDPVSPLSQR
ncbi:phage holin family protein [Rhodopirellula sp. JC740]|uniref:Phage holin family protein n=1 Tax=Rhodopirellula halodulae TaxID=2894198 RepID=A0ABS8NES5_9BACT|nr:phage holin family protein [Rhodopirellula sp. JC740]MCC9642033.1 phage holin family protein [Rhodopirellula sp. JC740]